jgi:WD40 repeat protein
VLWDAQSGTILRTLSSPDKEIFAAQFSGNGKLIVTRWSSNSAGVWDAESGNLLRTLTGHESEINDASFSNDSLHIVTASADDTCRVWDSATGETVLSFVCGHDVNFVSFGPHRILTTARDNSTTVFDSTTGKSISIIMEPEGKLKKATFADDGVALLTLSDDGVLRRWEPRQSNSKTVRLSGGDFSMRSAIFSPDKQRIVTMSDGNRNRAQLWDPHTGVLVGPLDGHSSEIVFAQFSADSKLIVTTSRDGTAALWRAADGDFLSRLEGHSRTVGLATFSSDGRHLLTVSNPDHAPHAAFLHARPSRVSVRSGSVCINSLCNACGFDLP